MDTNSVLLRCRPYWFPVICAVAIQASQLFAFSFNPGDIFVADTGNDVPANGKVLRVDPITGAQSVVGNFPQARDVAFSIDGGTMFVAQSDRITKMDIQTGQTTLLLSGRDGLSGVAVGANGDLFVAERGGATVLRVDPSSGVVTRLIDPTGFGTRPNGLTLEPSGAVLVSDFLGTIYRLDPQTPDQIPTTLATFSDPSQEPTQIVRSADGIFVGTQSSLTLEGRIIRIDPVTGAMTPLTLPGSQLVGGLAVDAAGRLIAFSPSDFPGNLARIDPQSGAVEILPVLGLNQFIAPYGIEVYSVPEPATVPLAFVGTALFLFCRQIRGTKRP